MSEVPLVPYIKLSLKRCASCQMSISFFQNLGLKINGNIYRNAKQSNKKPKIRFLTPTVFHFLPHTILKSFMQMLSGILRFQGL